ncbi:MAG: hypothetical protein E6I60_13675 [Chloroflexi bacterium]|nr:MAG: hypothetical protein E6I60_13675 [Chloroflexota bacterium]
MVDARVGQHRHAAGGCDQVDPLVERELGGAGNMGSAPGAHPGIEVFASHARLGRLDGGDDVRLADVASGSGADRLPVHFEPGRCQPAHRFPLLRLARLAGVVQALPQSPVVEGEAVAEQVGVDQAATRFILDR